MGWRPMRGISAAIRGSGSGWLCVMTGMVLLGGATVGVDCGLAQPPLYLPRLPDPPSQQQPSEAPHGGLPVPHLPDPADEASGTSSASASAPSSESESESESETGSDSEWLDDVNWQEVAPSFDTQRMFDENLPLKELESESLSTDRGATVARSPTRAAEPMDADGYPPLPWQPPAPSSETMRLQDAPEGSRTVLTNLVMALLPSEFEDAKKWGNTRKRWNGVKVRMDGLQIRTHKRWKEVNHGTWKRYHIALVDPEKHLLVKITDWQQRGVGTVGFQLNLAARVRFVGRRQEWKNGVRLYSVSAEGIADLRLTLGMQVGTRMDATRIPPDVILQPVAESAEARLVQFKLHRISKADGPIVREFGDGLEKILRKKLAEKNAKLVEKINQQFEKHEDDLRLSISDLVKNRWLGIRLPETTAPGKVADPTPATGD